MTHCPVAAGSGDPAEDRRLDELYRYEILDTEADARFDRIVALAAEVLDMPIALISLIDEDRQWFKARIGVEVSETPRAWAFCDHTIRGSRPLVVEDASEDARFARSPLVAGKPAIRFYAGAPLITPSGYRIGSLCVLDQRPRHLAAVQCDILSRLAETVVDLLESHRAARELQRKQKLLSLAEMSQREQIRYGRIFENSLNKIYLFDARSLQLIAANRGAREGLGYDEAEIAALTPLDLMPSVGAAQFERLLEPLRSGRRERIRFEREQRRKDGSAFPAEVTIEIDSNGERPLFVAVVLDVTERLAQQRALSRALAMTQSILDACQEAITTFVPLHGPRGEIRDFRCLQANAAACRMHGLSAEEIVEARLLQLWPGWRESAAFDLLRRVVLDGEPASGELQYADADRDGWFHLSAAPTGEGGLTLVVADITARKQHERALQRSNAALEQFATGVAHDLQTPLGQIAGFTQLLQRHLGPELPEKAAATLGYITQAAENMSELVRSLLDYARLGTLTIDPKPVDLQAVVGHCLAEFSDELGSASVALGWLPEVPGNAALLRQVFQNLIGNALKYRSERPLVLSIQAERSGSALLVAVEDNGIGIEPRHAERIFEVFRRLHSDSSPYPGLGMGLALCKTIVEAHGGRIWLDTGRLRQGERKGSRFLLELPLSPGGGRRGGEGSATVLPIRKGDERPAR
ncbi:PAS domain S-box-containing protein [Tistlia consotensis]|uniref:histidine kinase n=1 Tax=Tistlia consotensis USBA 355 TaxID=560819 RepID=A0A1Y6C6R5_9PROT|nr:PAS domain S-box protein [Tistlia consotensis]SMF48127.1 PAS domain S-box-containing protein [Tistlia consotensis USBA 355]SNR81805.1 PAS domain S-box-containing protein [Tistlia consotensis]